MLDLRTRFNKFVKKFSRRCNVTDQAISVPNDSAAASVTSVPEDSVPDPHVSVPDGSVADLGISVPDDSMMDPAISVLDDSVADPAISVPEDISSTPTTVRGVHSSRVVSERLRRCNCVKPPPAQPNPFCALPAELLLAVNDFLDDTTRICLRQTCHLFAGCWKGRGVVTLDVRNRRKLRPIIQRENFHYCCRDELAGRAASVVGRACASCTRIHNPSAFSQVELSEPPVQRRCLARQRPPRICDHLTWDYDEIELEIRDLRAKEADIGAYRICSDSDCHINSLPVDQRSCLLIWITPASTVVATENRSEPWRLRRRPSGSRPWLTLHEKILLPTQRSEDDFEALGVLEKALALLGSWTFLDQLDRHLCGHTRTSNAVLKMLLLNIFVYGKRITAIQCCSSRDCSMQYCFELIAVPSGQQGATRQRQLWLNVRKLGFTFPASPYNGKWLKATSELRVEDDAWNRSN